MERSLMGYHHKAELPVLESQGSAYGAGFRTLILQTDSNQFKRFQRFNQALYQFDLAYQTRTPTELRKLHDFYLMRDGGANTFPFRDPFDFSTASDPEFTLWDSEESDGSGNKLSPVHELMGVVDGVNRTFQCVKRYFDPSLPEYGYIRIITKPKEGNTEFNIDGIPIVGAAPNYLSGEVIFPTAPLIGESPGWRGEFDVEVGFAPGSDESFRKLMGRGRQGQIEGELLLVEQQSGIAMRDEIPYGGSKDWGSIDSNISISIGEGAGQVWVDNAGRDAYLPDANKIPDGTRHLRLTNNGSGTTSVKLVDLTTELVQIGPGQRTADLSVMKRSTGNEYMAFV